MWVNNGRIEPVNPGQTHAEWIVAIIQTANKSGDLNRRAALWTAAAVALSTVSTLLGVEVLPGWRCPVWAMTLVATARARSAASEAFCEEFVRNLASVEGIKTVVKETWACRGAS